MQAENWSRAHRRIGLRRLMAGCRTAFQRLVSASAIATTALLCHPSAMAADPITVRFVYDWPVPDFALLPIAIGRDMGFYARHGLKVEILFPPDPQTTIRMLATGRADIGLEGTTDVIFAANQGIPIVAIANYTQSNSWCLIGRPGETIDLAHLKGKSIGTFTDSWTRAMMGFVLKKANLQEGDVRQIITQNNDIALLLAKRIDIATNVAAFGIAEVLEVAHAQPALACNADIGVPDIPVWVVTASPSWLKANGAVAKAWLAGTSDAIDWAIAHTGEAAQVFTKSYPATGSLKYNTIGWSNLATLMKNRDGYFRQRDAQWTVLSAALHDVGQIQTPKAASSYYTNEYLSE
jgi:ABC-type nitrate/sulfonate/bicarbonate transport system substrate-binding protein